MPWPHNGSSLKFTVFYGHWHQMISQVFLFLNFFFLSWIINKVWYRCTLMATAMLCWTKLCRGYLHTLRCGTIHCARVIHKLRWQIFWYFFTPLTYSPICNSLHGHFEAKQKNLWIAIYTQYVFIRNAMEVFEEFKNHMYLCEIFVNTIY